jgi:hypothetical protein
LRPSHTLDPKEKPQLTTRNQVSGRYTMREKDDGDGRGWFVLLLTGLFLGLRLGGVTHWSWWRVFAPLWVPTGTSLVSLAVFAGIPLARGAGRERLILG